MLWLVVCRCSVLMARCSVVSAEEARSPGGSEQKSSPVGELRSLRPFSFGSEACWFGTMHRVSRVPCPRRATSACPPREEQAQQSRGLSGKMAPSGGAVGHDFSSQVDDEDGQWEDYTCQGSFEELVRSVELVLRDWGACGTGVRGGAWHNRQPWGRDQQPSLTVSSRCSLHCSPKRRCALFVLLKKFNLACWFELRTPQQLALCC